MKNLNEQINRINELMNNYQQLDESKYYNRLAQIMRGIVPSINTFAIITAENPQGQKLSDNVNKVLNIKLRDDLVSGRYGYKQITGRYNSMENPYFINRISKDDALSLGRKYDQESIVYGEKNDTGGMNFYLLECSTGEAMGERKVFVTLENPSDYYSEVSGVKFVIPFFAIEEFIKDQQGKDVMVKDKKILRTRDYSNSDWVGGQNKPTTDTLQFVDETLNEEYNRLEEIQSKAISTMGSTAWNYRGMLRDKIRKLVN
jgi:hypothetical protein